MREIQLQVATLKGTKFENAKLQKARLEGADISKSNFRDADLSGADLTDTILAGTDFRGADLTDTIFKGANLRNADFRDSKGLSFKQINDAQIICGIKIPENMELYDIITKTNHFHCANIDAVNVIKIIFQKSYIGKLLINDRETK